MYRLDLTNPLESFIYNNRIVILWIYFLPTISAVFTRQKNIIPIFIVNIFLGWTFVGWVVALAWAFKEQK